MDVNGVEFVDESVNDIRAHVQAKKTTATGITGWLIRSKFVQNTQQAEMALLLVTAVTSLLAAGVFVWTGLSSPHDPGPNTSLGDARPTPKR